MAFALFASVLFPQTHALAAHVFSLMAHLTKLEYHAWPPFEPAPCMCCLGALLGFGLGVATSGLAYAIWNRYSRGDKPRLPVFPVKDRIAIFCGASNASTGLFPSSPHDTSLTDVFVRM